MSNFEFSNEDFAGLAAEMENEQKKGTFVSQYWKPNEEGTYPIRIITPLKQLFGERLFYQYHKVHYINNHAYFCLNQTLKDKDGNIHEACDCPICNKSKQLYSISQKGSEEWNTAGSLRAKDRYVSRVIVRNNKKADGTPCEEKPEFWEFGKKIHEYFFNQIKSGQCGNFLDLKNGRDFNLVKKGSGRNTDYSASSLSFNTSAVFTDAEKLKAMLENLKDMDYSKLVSFVSPEEMKAALNEMFNTVDEAPAGYTAPKTVVGDPIMSTMFDAPATSVAPASPTPTPGAEDIDALLSMI